MSVLDRIDITCTQAIRAFVAASDALGPPGSAAVAAYWQGVRFVLPDWVTARAARLHPLSREYFDLQDQLYIFVHGAPYADTRSEFTHIDKAAACAGRLAYPHRTPGELNRYMRAHAKFVDQFDTELPCDVLEAGSGWGFSTEYLARLGHRVTAIDINPDFVDVAARRSKAAGLGIDYRLGRFESLNLYPSERFDVVYCFEAFHHARDVRGALLGLIAHLRPHGQLILFGEPFIDDGVWPGWGLRLDPLSVYCVARFGWWESGWTRNFLGTVCRSAGLSSVFIDEHSDLERYMVGRLGGCYAADQLSYQPRSDGWQRDRDYLVSAGDSRIEFHRKLDSVVFNIESFAPSALDLRFESQALADAVVTRVQPGPNRVTVPLSPDPPSGHWDIRIVSQTWNPRRLLGNGEDRDLSFHLRSVEEQAI